MSRIRRTAGSLDLNQSSPGAALAVSTAAAICAVFTYSVPRGIGIALKGAFILRMKLLDSVGVEMPSTTLCRFTYKTPEDPIWSQPIGSPFIYEPFGTLSLAEQEHEDHERAVRVNLGIPRIAFVEDEKLILEVYHATGTVDATYTEIYIRHVQVTPEELRGFVAERRQAFGK